MEVVKWRMLNTQLVVSYMGDSGSCPEDCGGGNKVATAEYTACGKSGYCPEDCGGGSKVATAEHMDCGKLAFSLA